MVQFRPGSHVSKLVALLSFVGEYPFWSLDLLGSERVYKALIVKLTQQEHFVNSQTGAEMDCRLFNLTGKGAAKSVRFYKRALPMLEWVHPGAALICCPNFRTTGGQSLCLMNRPYT